jgi:hypothetical protein
MRKCRQLVTLAVLFSAVLRAREGLAADAKVDHILGAASSGNPWLSVATEDNSKRVPEPGSGEASVGPGEAVYSERHQTLLTLKANFAVLKDDFVLPSRNGVSLPAGTSLANFTLNDPGRPVVYMRCSKAHTSIKQTVFSGPIYNSAICFREVNGFLVPHLFKKYTVPPHVRLKYELKEEVVESAVRGEGSYELLYQGVGGGVLRLTYREYTGEDLARPAFSQEVTYDIDQTGPTEILFKGAHITVLNAGNTAVRYRVDTPFKQSAP